MKKEKNPKSSDASIAAVTSVSRSPDDSFQAAPKHLSAPALCLAASFKASVAEERGSAAVLWQASSPSLLRRSRPAHDSRSENGNGWSGDGVEAAGQMRLSDGGAEEEITLFPIINTTSPQPLRR